MNFIRKNYKPIIACLILLIGMELAVSYFLVTRFRERYLSGQEALAYALEEAGVSADDAVNAQYKLAHKKGKAWYKVRFEENGTVYVYEIDAENGDVISSGTE